jgi:hypothetical protein
MIETPAKIALILDLLDEIEAEEAEALLDEITEQITALFRNRPDRHLAKET